MKEINKEHERKEGKKERRKKDETTAGEAEAVTNIYSLVKVNSFTIEGLTNDTASS